MSAQPLAYSYIRLSTEGQLKGHGRQRQLEQPADYANKHGLQLATDAQYEDVGISAFKGANVKEGALGKFLDAVETGLIPKGSYLLVESLDRVSRQTILASLSLFMRIIQAGINLVTLQDGHVYPAGNTEFPDLIFSLTIMMRAHEESLTKSKRVGAAWANKRAKATSAPLTKWCPAWLRLSKDRKHFEPIPEIVAIIQSIFDEAASGIGVFRISKRLNQKGTPTVGKANGWQPGYVAKILSSRAVIGEYQPCKLINGKRTPAGDPITNYYPAVIDPDLFYRVQQSKADRRINARGRKGTYFTNLFSGLATCAYCHSSMFFDNKGTTRGGTVLVCGAAKRGAGCGITKGWKYEEFEASFLAFVERVDLPALINEDNSEKKAVDDTIQSLEGRLLALREEHSKALTLIHINPNLVLVAEHLGKIQEELNNKQQLLDDAKAKRQALVSSERAFYESKGEIVDLVHRLQTQSAADGGDLYKLRAQVSARIKSLVKAIEVAPAGGTPGVYELEDGSIRHSSHDERYFHVVFRDGTRTLVTQKLQKTYDDYDNEIESEFDVREIDMEMIEAMMPELWERLRKAKAGPK